MRGVQVDRHQQQAHLALEVLPDSGALRCIAVAMRNNPDASFFKGRHDFAVVQSMLALHQAVRFGRHAFERLDREHAPRIGGLVGSQMERSPDFKKLAQVG